MTLGEVQKRLAAALTQPLTPSGRLARRTRGGVLMSREAVSFLKPNDRLSSLERLEIYSRSYWSRLLDSFKEDFLGLEAVLGGNAFDRLASAYLNDCPSRSFTLRDLGSQLEPWLRGHPEYAGRVYDLALDMVRLEWAHVVAFDGPEETALGPEDLLELGPALRAGVQPYITLLNLNFAVDELRVAIGRADEGETPASNVVLRKKQGALGRRKRARPERLFLAVHRMDSIVYYRRLDREEYLLLQALGAGKSIAASIRSAFDGSSVEPGRIPPLLQSWSSRWAQLGWLTSPRKGTHSS